MPTSGLGGKWDRHICGVRWNLTTTALFDTHTDRPDIWQWKNEGDDDDWDDEGDDSFSFPRCQLAWHRVIRGEKTSIMFPPIDLRMIWSSSVFTIWMIIHFFLSLCLGSLCKRTIYEETRIENILIFEWERGKATQESHLHNQIYTGVELLKTKMPFSPSLSSSSLLSY